MPVSYTHLDVYKRQVSNGISGPEMPDLIGVTRRIAELTLANRGITATITEEYDDEVPVNEVIYQYPVAVSYTHLDVYKRQPSHLCA